jgi:MFS superfamily sulfate permease-like transporter
MFKDLKSDLPASIVVFFVALPLCLGIALASGAPLFSGIIAGIVGGIVVGAASGSPLGVSGPAAGLAVIVFTSIETLGSWPAFLLAVVLAGVIQLIMGYAKAGFIAYFFPSSVIKGMLTGIGLLIILKQIPHALGYDKNVGGDFAFAQLSGENTFSSIFSAFDAFSMGVFIISALSLIILIFWEKVLSKKHKIFQLIQGPLVVIVVGITLSYLYSIGVFGFNLVPSQMVSIPVPENFSDFFAQFTTPDFASITSFAVWEIAFVIAIVASLETLLCVEATDKLDPQKRVTPTNRELKAQGLGNVVSGLIGGLPLTQVIVRSSANIAFGGKTKLSSIMHGFFLLISALTIAAVLNLIPLASLAAILLVVGYKLAKPALFKQMYKLGWEQFIPFTMTVVGIIATDLLKGIAIGMVFGIFFTLWRSYKISHSFESEISKENGRAVHVLTLSEQVDFFNKAAIINVLEKIPVDSKVVIDATKSKDIAYDVKEIIEHFIESSTRKNISVEKINL